MAGETESLVGLLGELHEVVPPPPVSMWPATPAWAVLGATVVAALAAGIVAAVRYRRATAWRREALGELAALAPGLRAADPAALATLQVLLRRVALVTAPRTEVAALSGPGWARYLTTTGATTGPAFGPLATTLAEAPYRPAGPYDGAAMLSAAHAWIRRQPPARPALPAPGHA